MPDRQDPHGALNMLPGYMRIERELLYGISRHADDMFGAFK